MKKYLAFFLILLLGAGCAACQPVQVPSNTLVLTTTPVTSAKPTAQPPTVIPSSSAAPVQTTSVPTATPAPQRTYNPEMLERFSEYIGQNSDFIGWISVPNTKVDYPVVQGTDDVFYVYNNFEKQPDNNGAIFLGVDAHAFYDTRNMVLHGHNMKSGAMFNTLHKYDQARKGDSATEFYKENPLVYFDTLAEEGVYKIFATLFIDVNEPETRGSDDPLFYYLYNDFESDEQFESFIGEILFRSMLVTTVDVSAEDEILMLSTCDSGKITSNGHFVLVCRKVREGESTDVNVEDAHTNENPLMDEEYYAKRGGSAPECEGRDTNAPWLWYNAQK